MLSVEKLTKHYRHLTAVDSVTFEVQKGEVFGFLGPNGAGKTTTIQMITGSLKPSTGKITVAGFDLATNPVEAKQKIGYIPDRPYLYEKLTPYEFLKFTGGLYGMSKKKTAANTELLLSKFDLVDRSMSLIECLSHGMKQRLVFCAALLPEPELLVVDEPMVGLDPAGARLVRTLFKEVCEEQNMTVFLSTHSLDVAEKLCDRITILSKGKVVASGTMAELQEITTGQKGEKLEEIFFELTDQSSETPDGN